mmetsp:Transcript_3121/g.8591  ORF Transcript_3121/g.8591 Transcript_3121/m.8591 type:complete len:357 (-) Transcript_3121:308-1378(-)
MALVYPLRGTMTSSAAASVAGAAFAPWAGLDMPTGSAPALPCATTSSFSILPLGPVPWTWARSMLCSLATLLTAGDASTGPDLPAAGEAAASAGLADVDSGSAADASASIAPLPPPDASSSCSSPSDSTSISTRVAPTSAMSPGSKQMDLMTPECLLVISMFALSDCTSQIGSNCSTVSPTATNHLMISHSAMPSPVCASGKGITLLLPAEDNALPGSRENPTPPLLIPESLQPLARSREPTLPRVTVHNNLPCWCPDTPPPPASNTKACLLSWTSVHRLAHTLAIPPTFLKLLILAAALVTPRRPLSIPLLSLSPAWPRTSLLLQTQWNGMEWSATTNASNTASDPSIERSRDKI